MNFEALATRLASIKFLPNLNKYQEFPAFLGVLAPTRLKTLLAMGYESQSLSVLDAARLMLITSHKYLDNMIL